MRPFHWLTLSLLATIAACGAAVIESSEPCSTDGSGGDDSTSSEENTTTTSDHIEDCNFETCSNADHDFVGPKGTNECNAPYDAVCVVNQTDHVFECQQIKEPPACPEWVHVGEWVDGGIEWFDGGN